MADPYAILGLQRTPSEDDAKAAFRKLAKTCHPDLHPDNPTAEKRFKEINAAYETICKGETQAGPLFKHGSASFRFEDIFTGMGPGGDAWEEMFGNVRARQRNTDMHLECRLSLEDIFNGKELDIQIPAVRGGVSRTVKVKIRSRRSKWLEDTCSTRR